MFSLKVNIRNLYIVPLQQIRVKSCRYSSLYTKSSVYIIIHGGGEKMSA